MSLLYKDEKDWVWNVETTVENNVVEIEFEADCGKFGTDEGINSFEIPVEELLILLYEREENLTPKPTGAKPKK